MGIWRAWCVQALLAAFLLVAAPALRAQSATSFDLPSQPLADSLRAIGRLTNTSILFDPPLVAGRQAPALKGTLTTKQALLKLLTGTGIKLSYLNDTTVVLEPMNAPPRVTPLSSTSQTDSKEGKSDSSSTFRLAEAGETAAPAAVRPVQSVPAEAQLAEVIVTAQKRTERLIDVPQSISVVSSQTLSDLNAVQFLDFANTVPGLGFTTAGAGYTQISMRGVTTGEETNPSVGIYVDDVPYGSSTAFAFGGQYALDMNLLDVDRVEVLRGPQGTLYGASTMGGLIKYVTKIPDTTLLSGDIRTGVSDTFHGGVSYDQAAAINLPLSPGVAGLRLSGYYTSDGGYIDNVALSQSRANRANIHGGRLDLLLTPLSGLTVRFDALLQNISRGGQSTADYTLTGRPVYGSLDQYRLYSEPFDQQFQLFSATLVYALNSVTLTSISSYQAVHTQVFYDFSAEFLPFFNASPPGGLGFSYSAVGFPDEDSTSKFTQELRVASKQNEFLEWLVGAFYTHEASVDREAFATRDAAGEPIANDLLNYALPTTYDEYALFGDLTYHIIDAFDVSGGVRYARNDQNANETATGIFGASYPAPISSSQGVFTYLGNARYHFNEHSTGYVRFATGYRPGGPNPVVFNSATGIPEVPFTFQPDSLKSYEVGYNGESADRRYAINADVYYIDWHNLQVITSTSNGFGAYTNAGAAEVRGTELTLTAHPTADFTATGAFAYQDPHLTEDAPLIGGTNGERLPNSAHFTGSINTDYAISSQSLHPTVGATFRYIGERLAGFNQSATSPQYQLPAYRSFDLRAGLNINSLAFQLFVHNLLDERGQLSAFTGRGPYSQVSMLQPRTIGMSLTAHF